MTAARSTRASVTLAAGDAPVTCSITNDDQPVEPRSSRRSSSTTTAARAVVDDFGITTDAGDARVRRRRRGPDRHVHLHRRDPRGRARHVHPRRARRWPATRRPPGPAPTVTAARSTRARSPSRRATTPVTCSITNDDQPVSLIIEKVVVNDDGGTAVVDDFGITTDAGDARVRRRRRGPHRHVHLHRRDPRGRARHVHPRRARGGRLRADRLDLHQRRRRRVRRGHRSPSRRATSRSPARSPTTTSHRH